VKFVLGFAAWLSILAAVLWVWSSDELPPALLSAAAAATWLLGGWLALRRRRRELRLIPDLSLPTVLLALGAAAAANGAVFGLWLILIGAGLAALGLAGVLRELAAARRAR
jgi:hypothetical protein